jgi:ComF family protein
MEATIVLYSERMLKTIGRALRSLLFPSHCELCGVFIPSHLSSPVCPMCLDKVLLIAGPHCPSCGRTTFSPDKRCGLCGDQDFHFDRAHACVVYADEMKKLLHKLKFGKKRYLTPFFSEVMARFCKKNLPGATFDVVPVPMDRRRRLKRGFNQSELLAGRLAASLGSPYLPGILDCSVSKVPQSFLSKAERAANVRDRFFVKKNASVQGRDILLVDDILTTGNTSSACAKALKDAGARSVTVLAFARGA